jgi:hypothetical protein
MGWIRGIGPAKLGVQKAQEVLEIRTTAKQSVEHVEDIIGTLEGHKQPQTQKTLEPAKRYPLQPTTLTNEELPFIPPEVVQQKRRPGALSGTKCQDGEIKDYGIVVDEVVYDCSASGFIHEHPGGEQVILSFVGEDCSWQFWRFHGKNEMEQYGKELRIGRTKGVLNRFAEPVRFVGLSKFGNDEW